MYLKGRYALCCYAVCIWICKMKIRWVCFVVKFMGNIYDCCLLSCTNVNDIIIMFRDIFTSLLNRRFPCDDCEDVVPEQREQIGNLNCLMNFKGTENFNIEIFTLIQHSTFNWWNLFGPYSYHESWTMISFNIQLIGWFI